MNPIQRLKDRIKARLRLRGVLAHVDTSGLPATPAAQHYELSDEEKYRRDHGYSPASTPMPATADIEAHNKAVQKEYADEVVRRRVAFTEGDYQPRFFVRDPGLDRQQQNDLRSKTLEGMRLRMTLLDLVNWDLEMTLDPGARVDVTKDVGREMQRQPDAEELETARQAGHMARQLAAEERRQGKPVTDISQIIGTDAEILEAAGGDQAVAAEVKRRGIELVEQMGDAALKEETRG